MGSAAALFVDRQGPSDLIEACGSWGYALSVGKPKKARAQAVV